MSRPRVIHPDAFRKSPTQRSGAYEATSTADRVADWDQTPYGPNAALDFNQIARARTQDAVRNNPWLRRAIKLLVSHLIGCGMQPRPQVADPGLRRDLVTLFNDWSDEADADGVLDFYGQQALMSRARYESGETFIRLRSRRPGDGLTVPLQVQILEADLLPLHHNQPERRIRQGIERNALGQRVAYWFYREHPGDRFFADLSLTALSRVPAEDVLHHYRPDRPGQLRGAPEGISTLYRARNIDQYESAELTRKKNRSKFNGVIWKDNPEDNPLTDAPANPVLTDLQAQLATLEASAEYQANDPTALASADTLRAQILEEQQRKTFIDVDDGYMLQLGLNERIELSTGDTGNTDLLDFLRTQLRAIAAGWGVPYELLCGDYADTNDRIMRVILNVFYRELEQQQDQFAAQVLRPLWRRWLDDAWLVNAITLRDYNNNPRPYQRIEWRAHAWAYVNPLQEAQTAVLKVKNGLSSRAAEVSALGWDVEDVDRDNKNDQGREKKLGLVYGGQGAVDKPSTVDKPTP